MHAGVSGGRESGGGRAGGADLALQVAHEGARAGGGDEVKLRLLWLPHARHDLAQLVDVVGALEERLPLQQLCQDATHGPAATGLGAQD